MLQLVSFLTKPCLFPWTSYCWQGMAWLRSDLKRLSVSFKLLNDAQHGAAP